MLLLACGFCFLLAYLIQCRSLLLPDSVSFLHASLNVVLGIFLILCFNNVFSVCNWFFHVSGHLIPSCFHQCPFWIIDHVPFPSVLLYVVLVSSLMLCPSTICSIYFYLFHDPEYFLLAFFNVCFFPCH